MCKASKRKCSPTCNGWPGHALALISDTSTPPPASAATASAMLPVDAAATSTPERLQSATSVGEGAAASSAALTRKRSGPAQRYDDEYDSKLRDQACLKRHQVAEKGVSDCEERGEEQGEEQGKGESEEASEGVEAIDMDESEGDGEEGTLIDWEV